MNKQTKIFLSIVVFILILNINLVVGQENETQTEPDREGNYVSDVGVEYDFEIVNFFNNQTLVQKLISRPIRSHAISLAIIDNETWVSVIIYLKDPSEIDNLISDFSEDELKNVINRQIPNKSSPEKIGAEITKEGFNKLLNDSRVEKIYYSHPMYLSNRDGSNKKSFIILLIFWAFILFILITYIIIQKLKN